MIYAYFIENINERVYRDNSTIFRLVNKLKIHEDDFHMDSRDDKSDFESLLSKLQSGDTVYVRSLIDISNSTIDLMKKLQFFIDMDIELISLKEHFYNAEQLKEFINFMVEANNHYREWAKEWGLLRAKESGKLGRPKNNSVQEAISLYRNGMQLMDVLRLTGVPKSTFFRVMKEQKNDKNTSS